jgi:hypothetical protein
MAFFKNKTIRGHTYDLGHLDTFSFALTVGEADFTVEVAFSCHCFTEKLNQAHTPDLLYVHGHERRAFNIERYELSKVLPALFQGLGTRSVYWSERRDFFVLQDMTTPAGRGPYLVFFDALRSSKKDIHVRLDVTSAYLKPGMSLYAAPVKFTTLISSVATNRALTAGPRQQIKRK